MSEKFFSHAVGRRSILKAGVAIGAMQVASPFVVKALGETPVKIGLNDPFTGTYAELGKHEQIGCQYAVDEINKKAAFSAARSSCWLKTRPAPTPAPRCRRRTS